MDDSGIVELFWERDERAIEESQKKYGANCLRLAQGILDSPEDAEECVNDTWMRAWNAIPPARPNRLAAYFAKITRNLALDRWRTKSAQKNGGGEFALCLEELDALSSGESEVDRLLLRDALERFLRGLTPEARQIFLLRYFQMLPAAGIAQLTGKSEGAVKISLHRTKEALRKFLKREGFGL